jgi:hypothetical protein
MKRFVIYNDSRLNRIEAFHTLSELVKWVKGNDNVNGIISTSLDSYWVEDKQEDVEVNLDDVIEAFDRGEGPQDLYFF